MLKRTRSPTRVASAAMLVLVAVAPVLVDSSVLAAATTGPATVEDRFGWSVAVDADTVVVGALADDNAGINSGSAYVFVRGSTAWTKQAKLTTAAFDSFGGSVAVSGDTVVVGAEGLAYVFVRSGTAWTQQAELAAADAAKFEGFGASVSVSGDTVVVGSPNDGDNSGSAYVFVRSGTAWTEQAKLTAADAAPGGQFGGSVAISGETVVVGAGGFPSSGSAYLFVRSGTTWTEQAKLTAADAATHDEFGSSVAISGESVVIGAPGDDDAGDRSGSGYVFVGSGTTWTQQAKLIAPDTTTDDLFGTTVAVFGDTVVVGAPGDDDAGDRSGSAYVFTRSGTTWTEQAKLTAADATTGDHFGRSVAMTGETVVVGAPDGLPGDRPGSAYVLTRSGTIWTEQAKLAALSPLRADTVGLVNPVQGLWHLRNSAGPFAVTSFYFGNPGDFPFVGDWDCDGRDTPGLFRQSDAFAYLRNSNTQGVADIRFLFGNPNDIPLAGDFDGDGCDTVSLYRPSTQEFFIVNTLGKNEGSLGPADFSFIFGNPGDRPVVGDWDGDGIDEVGLHRESTGLFYWRNTLTTGVADGTIVFGNPGDRFLAGDWAVADGKDSPAVFRPSDRTVYFRHILTTGIADSQFVFLEFGWLPVAGEFGLG